MKRRVNLDLDSDLVSQAAAVLGTSDVDQTVQAALEEVVRRSRIRLALRDLPDLTPASVDELRAGRPRRHPITGEMTASEAIQEDRGDR